MESNKDTRLEIMKLIGILGAIDNFKLIKTGKIYESAVDDEGDDSRGWSEIMEVIKRSHRSKFFFESNF